MQNHVEISSNGLTLRGYIHIPDNQKTGLPIVCMFHGFTGNKMEDHFQYVRLSRELEELGIGSIRMDFGNSGESDGSFENMTASREINDALNIIDYVYSLEEVDKDNIGIIGFSMGGMVASIAAKERRNIIKSMALISPAGNIYEIFESFFKGSDRMADINGLIFSKNTLEDMESIDPYEKARGFQGNVLIVHGEKDEAVPIKYGMKYKEIYGDKSELYMVKDANHIYSYRPWENEMKRAVKEFFLKEFKFVRDY